MIPMTMHHSRVQTPARFGLKIAGGIAGGFLILMVGVGIGSYPQEKRLQDEFSRPEPTCKVEQMPIGTLPMGATIIIPFPSEDSYFADYREGALRITPVIP